jgi:uncharacterized integral membrane protein (TIGR00697 family)
MDTSFIIPVVELMQSLSAECMALLMFLGCAVSVLFLFRLFGAMGLYLYNTVILLVANIQVLKLGTFWFSPEPVALGTVAFATTFLATDILTEHYGKAVARKGVWISFTGHILMTLLMLLTLGYASPAGDKVHEAMMTLFSPSPRILVAGLLAYGISQFLDISLFDWIGRLTNRRWLWLRMNVSTFLSGLVDNILFSVLAWVILSPNPVSMHSLIFTYILGTYVARALVSIFSTPIIYLSYWGLPNLSRFEIKEPELVLSKAA